MNPKIKAVLKILGTIAIAFIGGVFYRMGGSGNFSRFWRELGQEICVILEFFIIGLISLTWQSIIGTFLASGICWLESTYLKKKDADAKWWNWALVGLVFGIVPLPYCLLTQHHWLGFGIRLPLCIFLTVLWQQVLSSKAAKIFNVGKDITDEVGRGFINVATIPLLLI